MEIVKANEKEFPVFPYCEKELYEVKAKPLNKRIFRVAEKFIYFCTHCHKSLGISHDSYT